MLRDYNAIYSEVGQVQAAGILVISKRGHLLVGLRGYEGHEPGTWSPFGGKVEIGETDAAAAERELKEEAGLVVFAEKLLFVNETPKVRFSTFLGFTPDDNVIRLNHESAGYAWVTLKTIPQPMHPGFKAMLENAGVLARIQAEIENYARPV